MITTHTFTLQETTLIERYDALFEECPGAFIQQSTYWARVLAALAADEPYFLLCELDGRAVAGLPLFLFRGAHGNALISVPHPGPLGGIFVHPALPPTERERVYAELLEHALALAQTHHCLALTLITNPFADDAALYEKYIDPTFVYKNFAQYLSLGELFDAESKIQLRAYNRRSNLSRNLRTAHEANFTVKPCETAAEFDAFYRTHVRRHMELNARPLPIELFENIERYLKPRDKSLLLLVKKGDEVASGGIYIYHRDVVDVLRLTANSDFRLEAPNFLNTEFSLQWAHERRFRFYNWQSSVQRGDGVYQYKAQWGSVEAPYFFTTRLLCSPAQIQSIGADAFKAAYQDHFVLPYGVFEQGFGTRNFEK